MLGDLVEVCTQAENFVTGCFERLLHKFLTTSAKPGEDSSFVPELSTTLRPYSRVARKALMKPQYSQNWLLRVASKTIALSLLSLAGGTFANLTSTDAIRCVACESEVFRSPCLTWRLTMYVLEPLQTERFDQAREGIVEQAISQQQPGRVRVLGVSWTARLCSPKRDKRIPAGTRVSAVGRRGNTLLVRPFVG